MIETAARDNLMSIARTYAAATGLSLATVSSRVHGHNAFLADFEAGRRGITLAKLDEMVSKFAEIWPPKLAWPSTAAIWMTPHQSTGKPVKKSVA